MKYAKKILTAPLLLLILFASYTMFINRNTSNMTVRQKIMKALYPAIMWISKKTATRLHNDSATAPISFYALKSTGLNGSAFDFASLKGKKVLLVNTASDCGFTDQLSELEALQQQYASSLVVLGFPANDFKEQEKGDDHTIAAFCKKNYGVSFPLMTKGVVVKGAAQQPVYQWLTNAASNGWNSKAPSWNFSKYLVNERGQLTDYFDPGISPLSEEVKQAIQQPAR